MPNSNPSVSRAQWPELRARHAFHGLAGEFVRAMAPHTEADPAALLLQFLVFAGVMFGRRAGVRVGRSMHWPNLYLVVVGGSGGLGRKGTGFTDVRAFFRQVDDVFVKTRVASGLSSGEGFLMEVCDRITKPTEKGEQVLMEGVDDKRALWFESEFANVLATKGREGNTLGGFMRMAWDGWDVLRVATKNSPLRATGAHVGLIGHITPHELNACLSEGDAFNGFANRSLFVCSRASQRLPFGGPDVPMPTLADRLRQRLAFADHVSEVRWSDAAKPLWIHLYEQLKPVEDGLITALAARSEAQLVRLCLIYALLDESPVILPSHVLAAQAVWAYAKESLEYLFGEGTSVVDLFAQTLYEVIGERPGINLRQLDSEMHHPPRMKLHGALAELEANGLIARERARAGSQGGRPAETFYPANRKPANELVRGEFAVTDVEPPQTAELVCGDGSEELASNTISGSLRGLRGEI